MASACCSGCAGFTLWELLWALLIGGVLLAIGVPSLEQLSLDTRRTAEINAFVTALQLARSEATKRGRPVVLCKTADSRRCADDELRYDSGWMVFVNEDDKTPPHRDAIEPLLLWHVPDAALWIDANRARFEFRPFQRRSTNGTVTFCDRRGAASARAVIVSYTGRPRVSDRGPGDRALVCA